MQTFKIAHVVYSFGAGGIENGIVNLINMMDTSKFFHFICCLTTSGEFSQRLQTNNFHITELNKKPGNDWTLPFKLKNFYQKNNIDVIHLRGWPTLIEGIIGAKLAGLRNTIYSFHGKTYREIKSPNHIRDFTEGLTARRVKQILTLSEPMRDDLCKRLALQRKNVAIIHNGVDIVKFSSKEKRETIRKNYTIASDEILIGSAGRLDPVKNFPSLIKAYKLVSRKHPKTKLMIVGDGEEYAALSKLVKDEGLVEGVIFTRYRRNVADYLAAMDIYVQPSIYEGFSNTIIEAMAAKLPVLATQTGGNDFLFQGEENNFLFLPTDVQVLSEKLISLIDSPEATTRIGESNFQKVTKNYSLQQMAKNYSDLYLNIALNT